jgi:hypothetical protein
MMSSDPTSPDRPAAAPLPAPAPATLRQVAGAVFWSFFGVRKGKAMARDAVTIKPLHVIVIGVVFAAIFVLTLLALVMFITRVA